jgi:hypothetical protein
MKTTLLGYPITCRIKVNTPAAVGLVSPGFGVVG